jgi:hypothetical protein
MTISADDEETIELATGIERIKLTGNSTKDNETESN